MLGRVLEKIVLVAARATKPKDTFSIVEKAIIFLISLWTIAPSTAMKAETAPIAIIT